MQNLSNTTLKPGDRVKLVSSSTSSDGLHTMHTVRKSVTVKSVSTDRWGDIIVSLTDGNHWVCIQHNHFFTYERHTEKKSFSKRLNGAFCEVTR